MRKTTLASLLILCGSTAMLAQVATSQTRRAPMQNNSTTPTNDMTPTTDDTPVPEMNDTAPMNDTTVQNTPTPM